MVCDGWQECMALVPRMLRVWQAARCCDENPLPQMHARTAPFAVTPEFVPACDSLFALTEAVLRRKLIPARSCSAMLSRDEVAVNRFNMRMEYTLSRSTLVLSTTFFDVVHPDGDKLSDRKCEVAEEPAERAF